MASPIEAGCERAAHRVGRVCHRLYHIAARATKRLTPAEWHQHCLAAVYLAFADQHLPESHVDTFDWEDPTFLFQAARYLQADVTGRTSDYHDLNRRTRRRIPGAINAELCWDAWTQPAHERLPSPADDRSHLLLTPEYFQGEPAGLLEWEQQQLYQDLLQDLRALLKPRELHWLLGRYIDGKDQYVMADEFVADNPEYQGPGGRERAVNLINVVVHRTKQRLKKRLASKYRERVMEVA